MFNIPPPKGKIRDGLMVFIYLLGLVVMSIAEIFTGKPFYTDYVKSKLRKRFNAKITQIDRESGRVNFYINLAHEISKREKLYMAQSLGLTLRNLKFTKISENYWRVTLLPRGSELVNQLIRTFPNRRQQWDTGWTYLDYEPEEKVIISPQERLSARRANASYYRVLMDIIDYLMGIPVLGFLLRVIIWHRNRLRKIFDYLPETTNVWAPLVYMSLVLMIFIFIVSTFTFWAYLFCLLLAGYAIRRLKNGITIKRIPSR